MKDKNRICPVENSGFLDNYFRRIFQQPEKILTPFIYSGMTVLDVGCGPGFFTIAIARLLKGEGKVIAADIQDGMLDKIRKKTENTALKHLVEFQSCNNHSIGVKHQVDFILAFYMVHEVKDKHGFFSELKSILKPSGKIFIIEPKFHVKKVEFQQMVDNLLKMGFTESGRPKVAFSRSVLITN